MKRWLVRGGIALGVLAFLIVAFYAEENWRGARLWAATKAEYEAKGFSFDPKSLIPPPIPDEENFAKSPSWQRIIDAKQSKANPLPKSALLEVLKAVKEWNAKNQLRANWELGQLPVAVPIELFAPAQTELAQLYEDARRSQCQFPMDLNNPFPPARPMPELGPSMELARVLYTHSLAVLPTGTRHDALNDIAISFKLAQRNGNSFTLIFGLVSIAIVQSQFPAIWSGIERHQWSDSELEELQRQLQFVDCLQIHHKSLMGELCFITESMSWLQRESFSKFREINAISTPINVLGDRESSYLPNPYTVLLVCSPSGWFDVAKTDATSVFANHFFATINLEQRRFQPQKLFSPEGFKNLKTYWPARLPLALSIQSINETVPKFAEAQSNLDMAQIACGLERYWLAHKKYPATSAELVPKYLAKVPHDLCNGEPLHYRVEADGNYTLYSVGFNGTDDGGRIVMKTENPSNIDRKQGDWVWPRSKP